MPSELPAPPLTYEHRPRPFSNALIMSLKGTQLHAERGSKDHDYPLAQVEMLRLSFAPKNTQSLGFCCYLRMQDGRSLTFTNLDWRSMVENARQDAPYTAFVEGLVRAVAKANPKAQLLAGLPVWRHRLFGLGALIILPALAYALRALLGEQHWALSALALGLIAWVAFYATDYWRRNRPRTFEAGAIPPDVLPPRG